MPLGRHTSKSSNVYLVDSDAANADALSTRAQQAIQGLANRLAASSVVAFDGAVWNRKQALEKEAK